ncbi:Cyclic nucleotide-binding protein [Pseudocohnilembus persalinus]|uniref:Cyclic nucleotide-binding protein n=1 Tax=Pseudocohnilembus persalinus TaxID=266149 RepID=A0A0V0QYZ9_PSEPJ|nr:Cyclic nucleotide-binding protein [Pseudocohnilembus persalinus]|eukprot:KRX07551.1 Cyclic nucleotide-binding protein [Pseudocohnilembus persalinus]
MEQNQYQESIQCENNCDLIFLDLTLKQYNEEIQFLRNIVLFKENYNISLLWNFTVEKKFLYGQSVYKQGESVKGMFIVKNGIFQMSRITQEQDQQKKNQVRNNSKNNLDFLDESDFELEYNDNFEALKLKKMRTGYQKGIKIGLKQLEKFNYFGEQEILNKQNKRQNEVICKTQVGSQNLNKESQNNLICNFSEDQLQQEKSSNKSQIFTQTFSNFNNFKKIKLGNQIAENSQENSFGKSFSDDDLILLKSSSVQNLNLNQNYKNKQKNEKIQSQKVDKKLELQGEIIQKEYSKRGENSHKHLLYQTFRNQFLYAFTRKFKYGDLESYIEKMKSLQPIDDINLNQQIYSQSQKFGFVKSKSSIKREMGDINSRIKIKRSYSVFNQSKSVKIQNQNQGIYTVNSEISNFQNFSQAQAAFENLKQEQQNQQESQLRQNIRLLNEVMYDNLEGGYFAEKIFKSDKYLNQQFKKFETIQEIAEEQKKQELLIQKSLEKLQQEQNINYQINQGTDISGQFFDKSQSFNQYSTQNLNQNQSQNQNYLNYNQNTNCSNNNNLLGGYNLNQNEESGQQQNQNFQQKQNVLSGLSQSHQFRYQNLIKDFMEKNRYLIQTQSQDENLQKDFLKQIQNLQENEAQQQNSQLKEINLAENIEKSQKSEDIQNLNQNQKNLDENLEEVRSQVQESVTNFECEQDQQKEENNEKQQGNSSDLLDYKFQNLEQLVKIKNNEQKYSFKNVNFADQQENHQKFGDFSDKIQENQEEQQKKQEDLYLQLKVDDNQNQIDNKIQNNQEYKNQIENYDFNMKTQSSLFSQRHPNSKWGNQSYHFKKQKSEIQNGKMQIDQYLRDELNNLSSKNQQNENNQEQTGTLVNLERQFEQENFVQDREIQQRKQVTVSDFKEKLNKSENNSIMNEKQRYWLKFSEKKRALQQQKERKIQDYIKQQQQQKKMCNQGTNYIESNQYRQQIELKIMEEQKQKVSQFLINEQIQNQENEQRLQKKYKKQEDKQIYFMSMDQNQIKGYENKWGVQTFNNNKINDKNSHFKSENNLNKINKNISNQKKNDSLNNSNSVCLNESVNFVNNNKEPIQRRKIRFSHQLQEKNEDQISNVKDRFYNTGLVIRNSVSACKNRSVSKKKQSDKIVDNLNQSQNQNQFKNKNNFFLKEEQIQKNQEYNQKNYQSSFNQIQGENLNVSFLLSQNKIQNQYFQEQENYQYELQQQKLRQINKIANQDAQNLIQKCQSQLSVKKNLSNQNLISYRKYQNQKLSFSQNRFGNIELQKNQKLEKNQNQNINQNNSFKRLISSAQAKLRSKSQQNSKSLEQNNRNRSPIKYSQNIFQKQKECQKLEFNDKIENIRQNKNQNENENQDQNLNSIQKQKQIQKQYLQSENINEIKNQIQLFNNIRKENVSLFLSQSEKKGKSQRDVQNQFDKKFLNQTFVNKQTNQIQLQNVKKEQKEKKDKKMFDLQKNREIIQDHLKNINEVQKRMGIKNKFYE